MHMAIFFPYNSLAFHKSHRISAHDRKWPVFLDQVTTQIRCTTLPRIAKLI